MSGAGGGEAALSRRRLPARFFARPAPAVARDLLGRLLVRHRDGERLVARIVETEAYSGEEDRACHAARGRTRRNDPLYRPAGTLYVYFTYGMHWLLNVVTERAGRPAAVLLRAAEPVEGLESMRARRGGCPDSRLLRGPACLTRALDVDGRHNGLRIGRSGLEILAGAPIPDDRVGISPRIGVDYAGEAALWPWRFHVLGHPAVSGRPGAGRRRPGR